LQRLDAEREQQSWRYQNIGVRAQQFTDSAAMILSTAGGVVAGKS
jgi:hypothetical protein